MKQVLQNLIADNKLDKVIAQLLQVGQSDIDLKKEVVLLSNRFAENERKDKMNITDSKDYNVERNRIIDALLYVIDKLPDDIEVQNTATENTPKGNMTIQNADKIYNIQHIDNANFS